MTQLRVCVIGAGAAGLAALRHLSRGGGALQFRPVAFEQASCLGGTWVYTEQTGSDKHGLPVHASMYKNLRTNLPTQVMAFPDFPFPSHLPSFIMHTDMLAYLEDYASHFDLKKHVNFNTLVELVHPVQTPNGKTLWEVTTRKVDQKEKQQWEFDMVMVCNGHYAEPLMPEIPGLNSFKGIVMHSHNYREPEVFTGKRVACLGAGSSGQDISLDIARCAEKVYICHRKPRLETSLPSNVEQAFGITSLSETGFVTANCCKEIDALVLCTGYRYDFGFLSDSCEVDTDQERVTPLYKHVVHIALPTLSFIGIPKVICPFPMFDCQVQFVLATQDGRFELPSKQDMRLDAHRDFVKRHEAGLPDRHAHHMGPRQWEYNDDLADLAHFPRIPEVVRKLYDYVHAYRVSDLPGYKKRNFEIVGPEEFREISPARI